MSDVNHPSHYNTGKRECIEEMRLVLGDDVVKGFCIGNATNTDTELAKKTEIQPSKT